jgi:tetraprenyl-beta-curcumene synthase
MMLRALESVPKARYYLKFWMGRAKAIPDPELRRQALASIGSKAFHCEGGSVYGLLAGRRMDEAVRFIVAYQTISDYLDNLCDRSNSLDPLDFQSLHEAMLNALTPGAQLPEYYRHRQGRDDGGYLKELVQTCQGVLAGIPLYQSLAPYLLDLSRSYGELQVHKHVRREERLSRLQDWFDRNRMKQPGLNEMFWQEFSASAGSTLGIYALVCSAMSGEIPPESARTIRDVYFPWIQGLHILLDYVVDQEEDRNGGDLNFCSYYSGPEEVVDRIMFFFRNADEGAKRLSHSGFHRMVCRGLPALYFADRKLSLQDEIKPIASRIIARCGPLAIFFFLNCWVYRRLMS